MNERGWTEAEYHEDRVRRALGEDERAAQAESWADYQEAMRDATETREMLEAVFVMRAFAAHGIGVDVSVEDRSVVIEMADALRVAVALDGLGLFGIDLPRRRGDVISGVGLTDPDEAAAAAEGDRNDG